jgi:hypothetical protein
LTRTYHRCPERPASISLRNGILNQLPLGIIPAPGNQLLMEKYDLPLRPVPLPRNFLFAGCREWAAGSDLRVKAQIAKSSDVHFEK